MRQYGGTAAVCLHSLPPDVTFKEVVIIGNGPSGISASHLLAGHWPYLAEDEPWSRHPIIDQMFVTRLSTADTRKSLILQDLQELSDGLEGRIVNPVPLLMDNLLNPCADLGLDLPPMLEWRFKPERQIDHVVLGRGRPGGAWHCFDSRVLTLSPARWLRLAGGSAELAGSTGAPLARARVADVAAYYENYITEMGLQRFFRNNTIVTSIRPVKCFGHPSDCPGSNCPTRALWCVCGYDSSQDTTFRYLCSRIILATGASDRPNTLEAAPISAPSNGHSDDFSALYSLPILELEIAKLVSESKDYSSFLDIPPVLVVGSGLSAADAVVASRSSGLQVAHAYRRSNHPQPLATLPQAVYPDYYEVYQMMKDGPAGNHSSYTALPDHILVHIEPYNDDTLATSVKPKLVKLLNTKTNEMTEIKVSLCVILIGSKPDLSFLPDNFENRYKTLTFEGDNIKLSDNPLKYIVEKKSPDVCVHYTFPTDFNDEKRNERSRCPFSRHSFIKTQWHNLKTMVGHGLQGYKIRRKGSKDNKLLESDPQRGEIESNELDQNCLCKTNKIDNLGNTDEQKCKCEALERNGKQNGTLNGRGIANPAKTPNELSPNHNVNEIKDEIVSTNNLYESNASTPYLDALIGKDRSRSPDIQCSGLGIGMDTSKPIDCRSNPVDVDKITHEVRNAPKGLYALGPLTGDNFVRFIPGGALAVVANIWTEKKDDLDEGS